MDQLEIQIEVYIHKYTRNEAGDGILQVRAAGIHPGCVLPRLTRRRIKRRPRSHNSRVHQLIHEFYGQRPTTTHGPPVVVGVFFVNPGIPAC